MNKMKLDLASLKVDSFVVDAAELEGRGTVRGQVADCSAYNSCWCPTGETRCEATVPVTEYSCQSNLIACPIFYSEQGSCDGYCQYTDHASCGFDCTFFGDC